jgi:hypothetical protein
MIKGIPSVGSQGRSKSTDQFLLWLYAGDSEEIGNIIQQTLGIDLHQRYSLGELSK